MPTPWRSITEIERALDRGDLQMASAISKDMRREEGRSIPCALALRFLPIVAAERPEEYDVWARKWLARWLVESRGTTIESAAKVAASLVELPDDPSAVASIERAL